VPLLVRPKIGAAGFAFHDPNLALRPQGHDIDPQAGGGHQFFDADKVELAQRPGHPALEALAGHEAGKVVGLKGGFGHVRNMNQR
jgi:hypothetical protein